MVSRSFECKTCGKPFSVKSEILARYPGWEPAQCFPCKDAAKPGGRKGRGKGRGGSKAKGRRPRKKTREENLTTAQVLAKYSGGPQDGVFTDGACTGNPGPGGWGVVHVKDGEILEERNGHDADTTNNRMELQALIAAYEMLPVDAKVKVYSDSNLCVRTINEWAAGWKRLGWRRKTGPVENLELVRRAYELSLKRPGVELVWIKAHAGSLWNEYADALATAYARDER
ncbi:MAG: ribonuclease H [Acidobacteriota bacterium]